MSPAYSMPECLGIHRNRGSEDGVAIFQESRIHVFKFNSGRTSHLGSTSQMGNLKELPI